MKIWNKACASVALVGITLSLISVDVFAAAAGDLIVRGRIINVSPNASSDDVLGDELGVDSATTIEVDFTHMFSPNLGLELILATTKHDITAEGINSALGKVAETGVLPPTLTLQYHFSPDSNVRPYVGGGINYTLFYSENADALKDDLSLSDADLSLDSSFGLAAQAGVDVDINNEWFFNADIKYIQIKTEADISVNGSSIGTFDVDINPWVFGLGVGKTF